MVTRFLEKPRVRADSMIPKIHRTPLKKRKEYEYREQEFIKFPAKAEFHSTAEYLHAFLLEADPNVLSFVPQPYCWRVNGDLYTPDCFYIKKGIKYVVELKPNGEFDEELQIPLELFCTLNNMKFSVVSNEDVIAHRVKALNWKTVIQSLLHGGEYDTTDLEIEILNDIQYHGHILFEDVVDFDDRGRTYERELAFYRLIHRGALKADLDEHALNPETTICML